jgi:hypothetical protein
MAIRLVATIVMNAKIQLLRSRRPEEERKMPLEYIPDEINVFHNSYVKDINKFGRTTGKLVKNVSQVFQIKFFNMEWGRYPVPIFVIDQDGFPETKLHLDLSTMTKYIQDGSMDRFGVIKKKWSLYKHGSAVHVMEVKDNTTI